MIVDNENGASQVAFEQSTYAAKAAYKDNGFGDGDGCGFGDGNGSGLDEDPTLEYLGVLAATDLSIRAVTINTIVRMEC